MQRIGAGFQTEVHQSALGLTDLGVKGGGLNFELGHRVGWRHPGGDHIVAAAIGAGHRDAVQGEIVAVGPGSIHRKRDQKARIERTIPGPHVETRATRSRHQVQQHVRVAVGGRQIRYLVRFHQRRARGRLGFQLGRLRGHQHRLGALADGHSHVDFHTAAHVHLEAVAFVFREAGSLDLEFVRTGD